MERSDIQDVWCRVAISSRMSLRPIRATDDRRDRASRCPTQYLLIYFGNPREEVRDAPPDDLLSGRVWPVPCLRAGLSEPADPGDRNDEPWRHQRRIPPRTRRGAAPAPRSAPG